jgi:hypothetical protein
MTTKDDFTSATYDLEFATKSFFRAAMDWVDMAHELEETAVCQHCLNEHVAYMERVLVDVTAELARCKDLAAQVGVVPAEGHVSEKVAKIN